MIVLNLRMNDYNQYYPQASLKKKSPANYTKHFSSKVNFQRETR
jgi:hypothetical protein